MRNGINCKLVSNNLSAFIDNELEKEFSDEIKKHLCECLSCRRNFSRMLKLHYLLKQYFDGTDFFAHKNIVKENIKSLKSGITAFSQNLNAPV